MDEYDATQKPLRLNYLTVDPSGSITLVIDGHAQPGPTKAELDCPVLLGGGALIAIVSTPRPSDPYQALADLAATRAPYVHDGETYGIDVTDHDEEPGQS